MPVIQVKDSYFTDDKKRLRLNNWEKIEDLTPENPIPVPSTTLPY